VVAGRNPLEDVLDQAVASAVPQPGDKRRKASDTKVVPQPKPLPSSKEHSKPVANAVTHSVSPRGPLPQPRPKLVHKVLWMRADQVEELKRLAASYGVGESELIRAAWDHYMGRKPGPAVPRGRPPAGQKMHQ
jgi:hypothetical protein